MNEISITTPALLFSAISLIMLAYTNRFLSYAQVIRNLHEKFHDNPNSIILEQIKNLRRRLYLTRSMQLMGILSLFLCVVAMFLIYIKMEMSAMVAFGGGMVALIVSLGISIHEIQISVKALDYELKDIEGKLEM